MFLSISTWKKLRSPDATVTGIVNNILKDIHTRGDRLTKFI